MANSEAEICNRALARIGIKSYFDSLDDQTEEAQSCKLIYPDVRDSAIAAFPWPFATLRANLALKGDEAIRDGWRYVYAVPNDSLKTRRVWPATGSISALSSGDIIRSRARVPYTIEKSSTDDSQVLLCDLTPAVLFYTAKVTDPVRFPADFLDAFLWLLAAELAMPLTSDQKKEIQARERYKEKMNEARAIALSEGYEGSPPESEFITARY